MELQPRSSSGITVDSFHDRDTNTTVEDGIINATEASATTWASADSLSDDWINIAFSSLW